MRRLLLAVLLLTGTLTLSAQEQVVNRLQGRVSPTLQRAVSGLADSLSAQGLPVDQLIRKALEGSAKGVPEERILAAVRTVAAQLATSRDATRAAGVTADADAIEAGAYAINAGVTARNITGIAQGSRQPELLAASLRSTGTLVALGVPEGEAVTLVEQWVKAGHTTGEMLLLPQQLQAAMARGNSAAAAAAAVARGSAAGAAAGGQANRPSEPPGQDNGHSHRP